MGVFVVCINNSKMRQSVICWKKVWTFCFIHQWCTVNSSSTPLKNPTLSRKSLSCWINVCFLSDGYFSHSISCVNSVLCTCCMSSLTSHNSCLLRNPALFSTRMSAFVNESSYACKNSDQLYEWTFIFKFKYWLYTISLDVCSILNPRLMTHITLFFCACGT